MINYLVLNQIFMMTEFKIEVDSKTEKKDIIDDSFDHRIYLCSSSNIKVSVVEVFCNMYSSIKESSHKVIPLALNLKNPSQPINEDTATACFMRIVNAKEHIDETKMPLNKGDKIISLENGIYVYDDKGLCYDVCVLMVAIIGDDYKISSITRYNSFGVAIDFSLFGMYMEWNESFSLDFRSIKILSSILDSEYKDLYEKVVFSFEKSHCGYMSYGRTFGTFLEKYFDVDSNNWMKDPRFGKINRKVQIMDVLNKYLIDDQTDIVPDHPKPGVLFKHMTSVTIDPSVLNIMYDLLENFVNRNFFVDEYEYFGGMDARGFYTAPVMARAFKKGFIPIRKASKVPKGYKLATVSYGTEYSTDEFALEYRSKYLSKDKSKPKKALIFDDLQATGGSIDGAKSVLEQVGLCVDGAVMIYDVPALRKVAKEKLDSIGIESKVLISVNSLPNDFMKLSYKIPCVMFERLRFNLKDPFHQFIDRKYTLCDTEWDQFEQSSDDSIDKKKLDNVVLIYTERDREFSLKILGVTSRGTQIVSKNLGANITTELFNNGETRVKINTNIRNKHVVIVSRIRTGHINDDLIELFMVMDACNRAGVDKVTVILPYYPYSRSDKKDDPRCPIGAAVVAKFLQAMNINNLISVDLHAGQIQGYIDKGFHNLYMMYYIADDIYRNYLRPYSENKDKWNEKFVLIAPDAGSARTVKKYSKLFGINNIILDKDRNYDKPGTVMESRYVGSKDLFVGKKGIIIDDMADTMGSMCSAAKELIDDGLEEVYAIVTHGILSGPAIKNINSTPYIKEVVVTDSLPQEKNIIQSPKIRVLTCTELLGRALDGILTGRSISRLFQPQSVPCFRFFVHGVSKKE
jgi:ribose-phosphate pyrophosphokinase